MGHVLALVMVVGFIIAGFWQLSRHEWRADINDAVEQRSVLDPLDASALFDGDPTQLEYRNVLVSGTWVGEVITVANRSLGGASGCHVLSLVQPDGEPFLLVVNRGWIPLPTCHDAQRITLAPPADRVELLARVRQAEVRKRLGSADPSEGVLETMSRVDVARIDQQVEGTMAPVFVQVVDSLPPDPQVALLPAPPVDGGPHMAYAVQWFAFAAVGIIGYPLVLRWQARSATFAKAADSPKTD